MLLATYYENKNKIKYMLAVKLLGVASKNLASAKITSLFKSH